MCLIARTRGGGGGTVRVHRGRVAVIVAVFVVAQVPAQATRLDAATDSSADPPAGCSAKAPADPALWQRALPTTQVSSQLSADDPGCVHQVAATADGVVWRHPDGTVSARLYSAPVNFQGSDGAWHAIDTRVVSDDKGGLVNKAGPLGVRFASDASASSLVQVSAGKASVAFGFDGVLGGNDKAAAAPSAVAATVGGDAQDTVTYRGVFSNVDVRYEVLAQELKEAIILRGPLAPGVSPQFAFTAHLSGLSARTADDGTIEFVDASDQVALSIPAGIAVDSSGDPTEGVEAAPTSVSVRLIASADPSVATLVVSIDEKWLADPARVFPVTVDPTLSGCGSTGTGCVTGDAYVSSTATTTNYNGAAQYDSGSGQYWDRVGKVSTTTYYSFLQLPDLSGLSGDVINSATWHGYAYSTGGTGLTVTAQPVGSTSWSPSTLTWSNKPGVRSNTATTTYTGAGWQSIDISTFVTNWTKTTSPWAQHGIRLAGPTTGYVNIAAQEAPASVQPYVDISADAYPTMSQFTQGTASSSTPTLSVRLADTDPSGLSAGFQVWNAAHSTQLLPTPSGAIGSGSTVSTGQSSTWTLPSALADGTYTWRARATHGSATTAWSGWKYLSIDTVAPATPSGFRLYGHWYLTQSASDINTFYWDIDGGTNPATPASCCNSGSGVQEIFPGFIPSGLHDLSVRTIDAAGNESAVSHWSFMQGNGGFATPHDQFVTQQNVPVTVNTSSAYDGIALQWRHGVTDGWSYVPYGDVSGAMNTNWPVTLTAGAYPALVWNAASTASYADGAMQLRVAFYSGTTVSAYLDDASDINVTLNQNGFGSGFASAPAGPGQVNLLTGNLELSAGDVSLAGGSVARTFDSRDQSAGSVFGPGWTSNISFASPVTKLIENGSSVVVHAGENAEIDFTQLTNSAFPYTYQAPADSPDLTLTKTSSTTFTLEPSGSGDTYQFDHQAGSAADLYVPTKVSNSSTGQTTNMLWTGTSSVTYPNDLYGPTPPGLFTTHTPPYTCASPPTGTALTTEGCQTLHFDYASTTASTTPCGSTYGDVAGQLRSVTFTAFDIHKSGGPGMSTVTVANYCYDTTSHRLMAEWDPRISPALKTAYTYDSYGHVATLTPPGVNAWSFTYAPLSGEGASTGRLSAAARSVPTYAGPTTATTSYVYQIPLTVAAGGAYDLDATTTQNWGQTDNPTNATAIFPPDQTPSGTPPSSYTRATVFYVDVEAQLVNVAQPGGYISTTEYDAVGNEVRTLTPANRAQALATGTTTTDPADESRLLDSETVYDADDVNVTDTYGPTHMVDLPDGTNVRSRKHEHFQYDQGVPSDLVADGPFNLVTTQTESANGSDARVTSYKYDLGGNENGWKLGTPLQTIVDPGTAPHLNLATTTLYDLSTGQLTARILPANPSGGDAHETDFVYYTVGTNSADSACGNQPGWAGLPCKQAPYAQPGTSGMPTLPITYTTQYNMYGQPEEAVDKDTTPATIRTADVSYDSAGRPVSQSLSSSVGTAVDTITTAYDTTTGLPYTTTDATLSLTLTRTYDALGQLSTYQDADSNTTTYTYDQLGNVHTVSDGKGTTTYTYNTDVGTYGDPRGLLTNISDSAISGSWTASYDANGNLQVETTPNNNFYIAHIYNEVGEPTNLAYVGGVDWPYFVDTYNIHGERTTDQGLMQSFAYTYDTAGRLTRTNDAKLLGCNQRNYGFDADTNRTSLNVNNGYLFGPCPTSAGGTTTAHTYDAADRITDSGYSYDTLGRTTAAPANSSPSGYTTSLTYYTNDLVRSMAANGTTNTYSLDPNVRAHSWTDGTTTHTNHYTADSDSPAWTAENTSGTTWTRNIAGFGGLTATVDQNGTVTLDLANIHGDIFSTITTSETDWLDGYFVNNTATWTPTDEYGNADNGGTGTRYDYLGTAQRQRDTNSDLQLMGARVYNSNTGRFLQTDPVLGGSANNYDYAASNPIGNIDTTGQSYCEVSESYSIQFNAGFWNHTRAQLTFHAYYFTPGMQSCWNFHGAVFSGAWSWRTYADGVQYNRSGATVRFANSQDVFVYGGYNWWTSCDSGYGLSCQDNFQLRIRVALMPTGPYAACWTAGKAPAATGFLYYHCSRPKIQTA
jgi:RHS repeat-associated protein